MSDVILYRNDGSRMDGGDGQLEEIPAGIAILYADTAERQLYSFFNAYMGQPIQATAAYEYEAVETAIESFHEAVREEVHANDGSIKSGKKTDGQDPHRAFLALDEDPQSIEKIEIVKQFFATAAGHEQSPDRSGSGRGAGDPDLDGPHQSAGRSLLPSLLSSHNTQATLDYSAPNYATAARLFSFLVRELSEYGITIAVSKSGRTGQFDDVDVVIDIDPGHGPIVPKHGTESKLASLTTELQTREFTTKLHDPVDALYTTYSELLARDPSTARDALRQGFNARFAGRRVTLRSTRGLLRNYVTIAVISSLVGLVSGVQFDTVLVAAASQIEQQLRITWQYAIAQTVAVPSLYASLSGVSLLGVLGLVLLKRRVTPSEDGYSTLRYDLFQYGTVAVTVALVAVLLYSVVQLY